MKAFARAERADLAALLGGLSAEQWDAPSLCFGWRVRDVVAHLLSYEELGTIGLARRFARGRLRLRSTNALGLAEYADRSPEELLDLLERHLEPRGLTAAFGGRIALLDGMIHQQDIRRPLALPRPIPAERLTAALDFARCAPAIGTPRRLRGLRLVATDVDWSSGRGAEVHGPGEALLMAMAGRPGITDDLDGPGQPTLARRIGDVEPHSAPRSTRTVYEAAGGDDGLLRLSRAWHARVMADEVVSHAFSHGFHPDHSERLAAYWAEALGGPTTYSVTYGDETSVVRMHSGNGPHEEMDRRAIACFDQALRDVDLADDDRVRRVLHDYFAWATTTTMSRFHSSTDDVPDGLRIPHWSWHGLASGNGREDL